MKIYLAGGTRTPKDYDLNFVKKFTIYRRLFSYFYKDKLIDFIQIKKTHGNQHSKIKRSSRASQTRFS